MADYAIFYFIALLENLQNVAGLSVVAFALHHGVVQLGIELAAGIYLLKALLCEYIHQLLVDQPHSLNVVLIHIFGIIQRPLEVVNHRQQFFYYVSFAFSQTVRINAGIASAEIIKIRLNALSQIFISSRSPSSFVM